MRLVECVPNFSEGRRPAVVAAIRDAIAAVPGTAVLDVHTDAWHNRSVITFVAPPDTAADAAFAGIATAVELIDIAQHAGVHPRLGAADVVPFVPLAAYGSRIDDCVRIARTLGARVGATLGVPVYLYDQAATRPDRADLANVRRARAGPPDFGPPTVHPTAGAAVVGARDFLVAFNVYLGPATNMTGARAVARAVRASSGGLPGVKALALEVDGQAQVSMNLVDVDAAPPALAYEAVRRAALACGIVPTWSELVGLVPERALDGATASHIGLRDFGPHRVLERRITEAIAGR